LGVELSNRHIDRRGERDATPLAWATGSRSWRFVDRNPLHDDGVRRGLFEQRTQLNQYLTEAKFDGEFVVGSMVPARIARKDSTPWNEPSTRP